MLLHALLHPELPQVDPSQEGRFEGWYYKLVDRNADVALALIPGVAAGSSGFAFVQALSPRLGLQEIFRFPLQGYDIGGKSLDVTVGSSEFRRDGLRVNLNGAHTLRGELRFSDIVPFPAHGWTRGPMGPFGWLPGMECYHGIVNVRQRLHGKLQLDARELDFTGGSGYVEKDWGRSFPAAWVWLQGNHFIGSTACFLFSAAIIPMAAGSFLGFFALLMDDHGTHTLATYHNGKIKELRTTDSTVSARVQGPAGTLEIQASSGERGMLWAPKNGMMDRQIQESINAVLDIRWQRPDGSILFEGRSRQAGMECCQTPLLTERLTH